MGRWIRCRDGGAQTVLASSALGLGLVLASLSARAVDGVIEINQASALEGGITSCDQPGFPVQICTSGSYRLTSNLTYSGPTHGIDISNSTSDVTLDLNGMTIAGPASCVTGGNGWVTSCTNTLGGTGIYSAAARVKVRNGTVRGASIYCLFLGGGAPIIEDLVLTECGADGAAIGSRASVTNVDAIGNGGHGIIVSERSRVQDLVLTNNARKGILVVGAGGIELRDVVAGSNGGDGIQLGVGGLLSNFSAIANGGSGVLLGDGSLARAGVVRDNGVGVPTACGLQGQGGAAYREVVITAGGAGNPATACGLVNLGNNTCQGTSCPP